MLSIVIPAYNEEKCIEDVLKRLKKTLPKISGDHEIIVVDDGSKDKTAEIVKRVGGVRLIKHSINRGYGSALKTGLKNAKGDWVGITDADGTYPVEDFPKLMEHTDNYDMVVGARMGEKVSIPLSRRPAKWMLGKVANYLSSFKIPDLNSGLRVFKKDMAMSFFHLYPKGFSFTITITMASLSNDYLVKYVPINYYERKAKSTMRKREFVNFNTLMFRLVMYFRPMKIFMPLAIIIFLAGLGVLGYTLHMYNNVTELSILLILAAMQIGFIGMLADSIVKNTQRLHHK